MPKKPDLRDDDDIGSWNLAIEDALEYRRLYGREAEWAKNEALFYQAHETQQQNVGPNILASTGDSLLSTLLVPNPYFTVRPLRMDVVDAAPVLETQLNSFIQALQIKEEAEAAGLHAYLYGKGILKIGYDSEFGYNPKHDLSHQFGEVSGMSLTQFSKKGSRIEYDQTITPGMPWVKSILPHDFLVPHGVKDLKSAPWCAHRIVRHIDDIMADPKYGNKADLAPTLSMADWVKSYMSVMKPYRIGSTMWASRREASSKAEYVEMWEIHNVRTGRIQVLAQGHSKWLRNDVDYSQTEGLPFVDLTFVPKSRTFWVTPDSVYLQNPQAEAIDIAHIQRSQRRMGLLKFFYDADGIDNDELVKFLNGRIGGAIKLKPGRRADETITAMTAANNNNQLGAESEAIRRDARETVGYGRNQNGEVNPGRHTATEANIANDKAESRMDRRVDAVARMYCNLGRKLAKIIFTFWRTPRLTQIVGIDGAAQWTIFTGSQLKGEYTYAVGFSSEPVETHQSRVNQAMTWYQVMANDPTIDQIALRKLLVRAVNNPDFTSLFKQGIVNNASLSAGMPQMQQAMGGPQSEGPQLGGGGVSSGIPVSTVSPAESPNVRPTRERAAVGF